jgi:hypothetical protein
MKLDRDFILLKPLNDWRLSLSRKYYVPPLNIVYSWPLIGSRFILLLPVFHAATAGVQRRLMTPVSGFLMGRSPRAAGVALFP